MSDTKVRELAGLIRRFKSLASDESPLFVAIGGDGLWLCEALEAVQAEITIVRTAVGARDDETTGDAVARTLLDRRAEIAEMRKVTGPKCPRCGHWLKAEHGRSFDPPRREVRYYCTYDDRDDGCQCKLWTSELLLDYPAIAAELGLTKEGVSS